MSEIRPRIVQQVRPGSGTLVRSALVAAEAHKTWHERAQAFVDAWKEEEKSRDAAFVKDKNAAIQTQFSKESVTPAVERMCQEVVENHSASWAFEMGKEVISEGGAKYNKKELETLRANPANVCSGILTSTYWLERAGEKEVLRNRTAEAYTIFFRYCILFCFCLVFFGCLFSLCSLCVWFLFKSRSVLNPPPRHC